jgi:hypothetical protein
MEAIKQNQRIDVEEIVDTRDMDSLWKPILGTGEIVECENCGRDIVIHVYITVFDTVTKNIVSRNIIGTECCKKLKAYFNGISVTNKDYWKKNGKRYV